MCKVVEMTIDGRTIRVAEIKMKYMQNIVDAAKACDYIDRVVLFGSSTESRCTERSDIDLAIFGNQTKYKCLQSKKYGEFEKKLFTFDDHNQTYDLLYFKTGTTQKSLLQDEINKGEVLYVR